MLVLSMMIESISHSRTVYLISVVVVLALAVFSRLGKRHHYWSTFGIYTFAVLAYAFGIVQSIVTSPEEQTTTFIAMILAIPFWFGMRPLRMINIICAATGVFILCVLRYKTGYVQTADIVNSLVYAAGSIIISTYATCTKAHRFYAESLAEQMSRSDMLTDMGNRHAYTEITARYQNKGIPSQLTFVYLDVNELKTVNDTLGHHAGDELLGGAAMCIKKVFGSVTTSYRTGGDEFVVVGEIEKDRLPELCRSFECEVENWRGAYVQSLKISYGWAAAYELPDPDILQLQRLADSRLYEAKARYYSTKGFDRRGHQEAYSALCESYIKILRIDLTHDTCKAIRAEATDPVSINAEGCFSEWMTQFGASGHVHQDDVKDYIEKTDLAYLREFFCSGKTKLHIFYRRKTEGKFQAVMAEFMAAREYSDDHQIVFLYVKNIER